MYDRKPADQVLTFVVSGMLWNSSLVMEDLETGSFWSHLLGTSVEGELVDTKLDVIPAMVVDWETWKTSYPQTTAVLMQRSAGIYRKNFHTGQRSKFVVGLAGQNGQKAWVYEDLRYYSVVNDEFEGNPVVLTYDDDSGTALIYSRTIEDSMELLFEFRDGQMIDQQTESQWDLNSGKCMDGEYLGKTLRRLPGIPGYREAWETFYPKSEYWVPADSNQ